MEGVFKQIFNGEEEVFRSLVQRAIMVEEKKLGDLRENVRPYLDGMVDPITEKQYLLDEANGAYVLAQQDGYGRRLMVVFYFTDEEEETMRLHLVLNDRGYFYRYLFDEAHADQGYEGHAHKTFCECSRNGFLDAVEKAITVE